MPLYRHKCKKCSEEIEVIRSFDTYEEPPTTEESINKECEHEWERRIGVPGVTYRGYWSGKGNW